MTDPLAHTFLDYEQMGAHQAISMLYKLSANPGFQAVAQRLPLIEQSFPEVADRIQLEELSSADLSSVYSEGIDYQRCRLRISLITTPEEEYYLASFVHHSFADGLGGVELMKRLFLPPVTRDLNAEAVARKDLLVEERGFSKTKAFQLSLAHLLRQAEIDFGNPSKARAIHLLSLPLTRLRKLKKDFNCSLNELYLYGVSSALRHIHPKRVRAHILVPVNLRPRALQHALGNNLLVYPLRVELKELSMNNVITASRPLRDLSSLSAHRSARNIVANLPSPLRQIILRRIAKISTCIATFVPQNSPERCLGNAVVTEQYGFPALLPGHEIGFGLSTYRNHFCVSIITAGSLLGREDEVGAIFTDSFTNLERS